MTTQGSALRYSAVDTAVVHPPTNSAAVTEDGFLTRADLENRNFTSRALNYAWRNLRYRSGLEGFAFTSFMEALVRPGERLYSVEGPSSSGALSPRASLRSIDPHKLANSICADFLSEEFLKKIGISYQLDGKGPRITPALVTQLTALFESMKPIAGTWGRICVIDPPMAWPLNMTPGVAGSLIYFRRGAEQRLVLMHFADLASAIRKTYYQSSRSEAQSKSHLTTFATATFRSSRHLESSRSPEPVADIQSQDTNLRDRGALNKILTNDERLFLEADPRIVKVLPLVPRQSVFVDCRLDEAACRAQVENLMTSLLLPSEKLAAVRVRPYRTFAEEFLRVRGDYERAAITHSAAAGLEAAARMYVIVKFAGLQRTLNTAREKLAQNSDGLAASCEFLKIICNRYRDYYQNLEQFGFRPGMLFPQAFGRIGPVISEIAHVAEHGGKDHTVLSLKFLLDRLDFEERFLEARRVRTH